MSYATKLTQLKNQLLLILFKIMNNQTSILKFEFLMIKMCLDKTYPTTHFNISLVIEDKISDCLVRVEIHLSISRQPQSTILNLNLLNSLNTKFL